MAISSYGVAGVTAALIVVTMLSRSSKLDTIPTVGSSGWFGSWFAGLRHLTDLMDVIQEGYEKYKLAPFKVATFFHWTVIFSSREHVEELQRAPVDTLSSSGAMTERLQFDYTIGSEVRLNPYHVSIVRSRLNRNLGALYPDMRDEIIAAFDGVLDLKGNEWKSITALRSVQEIICRTSNRVFVGLPLCRDPNWIDLNIRYTLDIVKGAAILGLFPNVLKPIATGLLTNIPQNKLRGQKLLGPMIEERRKYLNEYGNKWADKPNDFLTWLMEEAEGPELTVEALTTRMLVMNFGAVHTSAASFVQALFYLTANPQYVQPLREEVEGIVEKEGWSKSALSKMRKIDSFLKECQRIEGVACVGLQRKALRDFTFSDGTFIPKGTMIATAASSVHHDEALYENAHAFEPFRFADLQEEDDEGAQHQFVSMNAKYMPWGLGRQACPGRYFAASELKTMLAHVVVTYDIMFEDNATLPQPLRFLVALLPDPRAKVMFRRRVD